MFRKEQRCYAEKRNTKSTSKGSSDRTLHSTAVPGFSLHSEEESDSTVARGVHCQRSVPEPDLPTSVTSSSSQIWDRVLGVMLGVTIKALCHHFWCLSRSPRSSTAAMDTIPRFPTHPAASLHLIWKLNFIPTQNGGVTVYGSQPPAPPKKQTKSLTKLNKTTHYHQSHLLLHLSLESFPVSP